MNILEKMAKFSSTVKPLSQKQEQLMYYCSKGEVILVKTLLDDNVDVNCYYGNGKSPLHECVVCCDDESLSNKALANNTSVDKLLANKSKIIELLIKAGIDPNIKNPITDQTPLDLVESYKQERLIESLKKNGAISSLKPIKTGWIEVKNNDTK